MSCFLVFPLSQFHSDLPETRDVPFRGLCRRNLNLKLMWRKGAKSTWACEKILDKPGSPQNSLLRKEKLSILPTSSWNLGLYPHFRTNPLEKTTAEIASNSDWVCQILLIGYTKIHCVITSFINKNGYLELHITPPTQVSRTGSKHRKKSLTWSIGTGHDLQKAAASHFPSEKLSLKVHQLSQKSSHSGAMWIDTPIQWLFQSQHFYKSSITINNRSL